jgi:serine/threonine-protein kinase
VGTRKRCAVKLLLRPELASDAEVSKRFFREARAGGLIESEHVVAAYDSGVDATGRLYYVMECLSGQDLSELLERVGCLHPRTVIKLMMQACAGLASAHALGVVHRDIKPGNLFLALGPGDEVRVKILDFGVAKVKLEVFEESASSLTRMGSLLGTPQYMSPEQVKRASAIDESADICSLGVVMYECLTGALPWGDVESVGELIAAILTQPVPSVQDRAPWIEADLASVVQRALSRDSASRLRSATELRDLLLGLTPAETRVYLHELRSPTELEQSRLAPRFVHADTLPLGESGSSIPVVASQPPRKRASRYGIAGGALVGAVAAASAWTLRAPPNGATAPQSATAAVTAAASAPTPSPLSVPSVVTTTRALPLEVGPAGVAVSIDGVSAPVVDGKVTVEGAVGAVHQVRLSHRGQSKDEAVIITVSGLMPPRLSLPAKTKPAAAPAASAPAPAAPPAAVSTAETVPGDRLTPKFE